MIKSTILLTILMTSAVLSDSVDSKKDFIYIGSFKSEVNTLMRRSGNVDENAYYFSVHSTTWSRAIEDCRKIFGGNNVLVAIESFEEWEFLRHKLEKYGGRNYWTSGMYDSSKKIWKWAANNRPFPPFAPWGTGFSSNTNKNLRVIVNGTNRYDASWSTAIHSQAQRYICEVQRLTVSVPCYETNDLIIVIDSSGSIGPGNYEVAKDFLNQLMEAFTVYKENRISLITYSNKATKIVDIKNTFTPAEISSKILSMDYRRGKTKTYLGIDLAVAEFKSSQKKVPLNMVVLTDGMSNDLTMTAASATSAANLGIRTFSVGITPNINETELLTIAGGDSNRIFTMAIFAEIIQMLAPISVHVCPTALF